MVVKQVLGAIYSLWIILFRLFEAPGTIIHELAHMYFCSRTGTRVADFRLLELNPHNPAAGWIKHHMPEHAFKQFVISLGPLLINSIVLVIGTVLAALAAYFSQLVGWILLWIAITSGLAAIPSFQDVVSLKNNVFHDLKKGKWLTILLLPFTLIIYAITFLIGIVPRIRSFICIGYALVLFTATLTYLPIPLWYNLLDESTIIIENIPTTKSTPHRIILDNKYQSEFEKCTHQTSETFDCRATLGKDIFDEGDHSINVAFGRKCREWKVKVTKDTFLNIYRLNHSKGHLTTCRILHH